MKTIFNKTCEGCAYHKREEDPNATIILQMCRHPWNGIEGRQILSFPSNTICPVLRKRVQDPVFHIEERQYGAIFKALKIAGEGQVKHMSRQNIQWNLARGYVDSAFEFAQAPFTAIKFDLIGFSVLRLESYLSNPSSIGYVSRKSGLENLGPALCLIAYCVLERKSTLIVINDPAKLRDIDSEFEFCGLTVKRHQIKLIYEVHAI